MCSRCKGWYTETHKDYIRGGVDASDFEEDPVRRKAKKSRRKGRKRVCAKTKTDEVCTPDVWVEKWRYFSKTEERWIASGYMSCKRCGRHISWGSRRYYPRVYTTLPVQ